MTWLVIEVGPDEVHIVPDADFIEHTKNDECICGPATIFLDGGKKMITHASLDGREFNEPDYEV